MERDDVVRLLAAAETKSAGAEVIVADAEARRVAAELRVIDLESRALRLEEERNAALALLAPLRAEIERIAAEREDEAAGRSCMVCDRLTVERDTLAAALAEVIARLPATFRADGIEVPRSECAARNRALHAALTDTKAAAEAYTRRVRAEALREAASALRRTPGIRSGTIAEALVRARADEIERGDVDMRRERRRR